MTFFVSADSRFIDYRLWFEWENVEDCFPLVIDDPSRVLRGSICLREGVATSIEQFLKRSGILTILVDWRDVFELWLFIMTVNNTITKIDS
jgi:hypothetical protein